MSKGSLSFLGLVICALYLFNVRQTEEVSFTALCPSWNLVEPRLWWTVQHKNISSRHSTFRVENTSNQCVRVVVALRSVDGTLNCHPYTILHACYNGPEVGCTWVSYDRAQCATAELCLSSGIYNLTVTLDSEWISRWQPEVPPHCLVPASWTLSSRSCSFCSLGKMTVVLPDAQVRPRRRTWVKRRSKHIWESQSCGTLLAMDEMRRVLLERGPVLLLGDSVVQGFCVGLEAVFGNGSWPAFQDSQSRNFMCRNSSLPISWVDLKLPRPEHAVSVRNYHHPTVQKALKRASSQNPRFVLVGSGVHDIADFFSAKSVLYGTQLSTYKHLLSAMLRDLRSLFSSAEVIVLLSAATRSDPEYPTTLDRVKIFNEMTLHVAKELHFHVLDVWNITFHGQLSWFDDNIHFWKTVTPGREAVTAVGRAVVEFMKTGRSCDIIFN